jgi:hypothetical protein
MKNNKPRVREGMVVGNRKSYARNMRAGITPIDNNGDNSTHVMSWGGGGPGSKKYKYSVNPTIFTDDKGKTWNNLSEKPKEAYDEAKKRGEVIGFRSAKRAEKFAAGSWKKGADRKEAMKSYRGAKKKKELYTQSEEFKKEKKNRR